MEKNFVEVSFEIFASIDIVENDVRTTSLELEKNINSSFGITVTGDLSKWEELVGWG